MTGCSSCGNSQNAVDKLWVKQTQQYERKALTRETTTSVFVTSPDGREIEIPK